MNLSQLALLISSFILLAAAQVTTTITVTAGTGQVEPASQCNAWSVEQITESDDDS
jgi:hypothetical protein